jgi:hypothetical protein
MITIFKFVIYCHAWYRLAREHYLNTEEFIDAVAAELRARLSA